jgi:hypothetical protein
MRVVGTIETSHKYQIPAAVSNAMAAVDTPSRSSSLSSSGRQMKCTRDVTIAGGSCCRGDEDDIYLKKITTRVSQNLILPKTVDQPKA